MKKLSIVGFLVASLAAASGYFGGSGSATPSGPAGGDLTGTYPNPTLAVDRVRKVGDTMSGTLSFTSAANPSVKGLTDFILDSNSTTYIRSAGNTRVSFDAVGTVNLGQPYNWGFIVRAGDTMSGNLALNGSGTSPSTVPYLDASRVFQSSAITPTELGYLTGLTGNVQAQLNSVSVNVTGFVAKTGDSMSGDLQIGNSAGLFTNRIGNVDSFVEMISMDATDGVLKDLSGVSSLVWTGRKAYSTTGVEKIDWQNSTLSNSGGPTLDWGISKLYRSGVIVADWSTPLSLYDSTGVQSVDWSSRSLIDSGAIQSVNWENRTLLDSSGNIVASWPGGNLAIEPGAYVTNVATPVNPTDAANKAYVDGISVNAASFVMKAGDTMTGGLGTTDLRLPYGSSPGTILYGSDTDTGPYQTGDGEYFIAANGFERIHVSQNYTGLIGPVTATGNIDVTNYVHLWSAPINPEDAANKAYVDSISVNVSGTANTLAGFNNSGDLYSAPHWGLDADGKIAWNDTFATGVTVPDGVDIGLYGTFQNGSVNNNRTFIRMQPSYEPGSAMNSLLGYHFAPTINTTFTNYYAIDHAVTLDGSANGSNGAFFNVHDVINTGAQLSNGYTGGAIDITVNSASYVNGFTGFNDSSDFLAGASVSGITSYSSSHLIGATVNGSHIGYSFSPTYQSTSNIINNAVSFIATPNFGGEMTSYTGVQVAPTYQSTSTPDSHVGLWLTPQIASEMSNNGGYVAIDDGATIQSGGKLTNPQGLSMHMQYQTGSTMSGNFNYVNIGPSFQSGVALEGSKSMTLLNISPQIDSSVVFDSIQGLQVSLQGVALSSGVQPVGIGNEARVASNYDSIWPNTPFFQFNYVGGQATVPAGQPVANGFAFGINLASGLVAADNVTDDGTGLNLGFVDVGFVGSMTVLSGVTVDAVNMALGGAGIPAASTGGTIEDASMFTAAGFLPQGGTLNVTNVRGFRAAPTLCTVASGTCRGISIDDPLADNYLASTITLDGLTANTVPYLDSTKTLQSSAVTDTELGYLSGATANIQTQLNGKLNLTGDTMTGALLIGATTNALKISNPPAATGTNLIAANTVSRSDSTNAGYMSVSATSNPIFEGVGYGNATTRFRGYRASGSDPSAPAAITGSGGIAQLEAFGHDGTSFESGAGVFLRSSGTWSTSDHRTNIQLLNTLQGTTTLVTSLQVGDLGDITMGPSGVTVNHTVNGGINMTRGLTLTGVTHGIAIKEGTNARMGVATLTAGTVTVSTTSVTANSRIMLTGQNSSGTHGELTVSARTAGTSFTITSTSALDTRDVAWIIFEPSP